GLAAEGAADLAEQALGQPAERPHLQPDHQAALQDHGRQPVGLGHVGLERLQLLRRHAVKQLLADQAGVQQVLVLPQQRLRQRPAEAAAPPCPSPAEGGGDKKGGAEGGGGRVAGAAAHVVTFLASAFFWALASSGTWAKELPRTALLSQPSHWSSIVA